MREFFTRLSHRATVAGNSPALVAADGVLTYSQLLERVRGAAQWSTRLPPRIGSLLDKSADGIVADLALSYAGKELVPLPAFFSDAQLLHVVRTAGLTHAVSDRRLAGRAMALGLIVCELGADAVPDVAPAPEAGRIIFTSGTTGQPKGVQLSSRQILASVAALAEVTGATSGDRYLSLLPDSLLLEQIAGTYLSLSVGAEVRLSGAGGMAASIATAAEDARATATVVVPELLAAWLNELRSSGRRAPASLRYVAVGGAPVSQQLADAAWAQGLPIHEGYGLSECCSVVAVNRPGARRSGTVGRPLPGIEVAIANGEIVVSGPTVMNGYLHAGAAPRLWPTGDLGHFDSEGFLVVTGRKDNVIVTSAGRNISPEWVEDMMTAEGRIRRCIAVEHDGELAAVVVPHDPSMADAAAMHDIVRSAVRRMPDYAKPRRFIVLSDEELRASDLLTANFRPRRSAIRRFVSERHQLLSHSA
jgi:long-subunit acyl-CoA synthetase (AMP-forming)